MKTLNQHNAEAWERHDALQEMNNPHPNGISCPDCGKELWDSEPGVTLTSYPAQKNIHCPACGYIGYRIA